jgi:hypothetical protein
MASERTLKRRMDEPRGKLIEQGPTVAELMPKRVVSANRATRLKIERRGLTRAQRLELADKRKQRKWQGIEPEQPKWASAPGKDDLPADPKHMQVIVDDVAGLFERGMLTDGESFDQWKTRCLQGVVTRRQLDRAVAEVTARVKDEDPIDFSKAVNNQQGGSDG